MKQAHLDLKYAEGLYEKMSGYYIKFYTIFKHKIYVVEFNRDTKEEIKPIFLDLKKEAELIILKSIKENGYEII